MQLRMLHPMRRIACALAVIGVSALGVAAPASVRAGDLVQNGGFETYTDAEGITGGALLGANGSIVADWTSSNNPNTNYQGGNFLYTPPSTDMTGSFNPVIGYGVALWGPPFGSNNGLPEHSPAGGNYIGMDGDQSYFGLLSQSISGLTVGQSYRLSFYFAGAQEYPYSGSVPLTAELQVGFGSQTQDTPILSYAPEGFTGWQLQTMTFVADATSDTLSFLALSTPNGVPPFVLLDGVSLTPEPSAILMLSIGLVGVGVVRRLHKLRRGLNR